MRSHGDNLRHILMLSSFRDNLLLILFNTEADQLNTINDNTD